MCVDSNYLRREHAAPADNLTAHCFAEEPWNEERHTHVGSYVKDSIVVCGHRIKGPLHHEGDCENDWVYVTRFLYALV